jgi:hypothetical protein
LNDDDCGAVFGMNDWEVNLSTRIKPAPVQLWPPEILHLTGSGLETGPPQWEAGDQPRDLRHVIYRGIN